MKAHRPLRLNHSIDLLASESPLDWSNFENSWLLFEENFAANRFPLDILMIE
jgi:hypothetical protein